MSSTKTKPFTKVLRAYGWEEPYQIYRNKNTWLISCPKGKFFLKRSRISSKNFTRLQAILDKIRWDGYTQLLPFIHTKKGEAIVSDDHDQWYATPWKKTRNLPFQVDELVRSLARFHRLAEPYVRNETDWQTTIDQNWIHRWQEKRENIKKEKQKIEQEEFPSPFEYSLSKHYQTIDQSLDFAIRGMEKFIRIEKGRAPRYTLCHNRIHPSNLVYDHEDFYWIDFDHASLDSPVRDLALFIHRFSHLKAPNELLQLYERENQLLPKEKRLLALYLAYPERILKRMSQYREGITISEEPISQQRLEKEIEKLSEIQQLVVKLWPNQKG